MNRSPRKQAQTQRRIALRPGRYDFKVRGPARLVVHLSSRAISRLDRLLLLLDTGSSASVRNTAAKQLAQLAAKSVAADLAITDDDHRPNRQHVSLGDPSAWAELLAVVARVRSLFSLPRNHSLNLSPDFAFLAFKIFRYSHCRFCCSLPHLLPRSALETFQHI